MCRPETRVHWEMLLNDPLLVTDEILETLLGLEKVTTSSSGATRSAGPVTTFYIRSLTFHVGELLVQTQTPGAKMQCKKPWQAGSWQRLLLWGVQFMSFASVMAYSTLPRPTGQPGYL
jgi:hypothetical protein